MFQGSSVRVDCEYRLNDVIVFQGSYPVRVDCEYRLDGYNYMDQATLRSSTSKPEAVWCECDVFGLTQAGSHAGRFDPIPSGQCLLTISQCPVTTS